MKNRAELERKVIELQAIAYERATRNLKNFFIGAWKVLEPATKLIRNWHQDEICEYLTAAARRQIKRLIINVPPRMTKSTTTSICFPCWTWIDHPETRFLCTSYSGSLSTKHSGDRRTLIKSEWYQGGWGDRFKLEDDQNTKTDFSNNKRGEMFAISFGGAATGRGGDFIIIDDPHPVEVAHSRKELENDITAFDQKISTRLDDKINGVIIVIMQRLHEADLSGHLLAQGGWTHVRIPAIAEGHERRVFPISGKVVERRDGELLHAEREGPEQIAEKKKGLGEVGFAGQYQQAPRPLSGGIFKREWWRRYQVRPTVFDYAFQSWDVNLVADGSSFAVGQAYGIKLADIYLLGQVRGKWGFNELLQQVRYLSSAFPDAFAKIVENKANGPAMQEMLSAEIPGVILVEPLGGKEARAMAAQPFVEAGNFWIPEASSAPWVPEFTYECETFPNAINDDQVDAMSQAIAYVKRQAQAMAASGGEQRAKNIIGSMRSVNF